MRTSRCTMIRVHHPDCGYYTSCQWCRLGIDEQCGDPTVATYERDNRVCEECAVQMQLEGFEVRYDDNRKGIAS